LNTELGQTYVFEHINISNTIYAFERLSKLIGFVLQILQILTKNFDHQWAYHPGHIFFHIVLNGLTQAKINTRKSLQAITHLTDQCFFSNFSLPLPLGLEFNIKFYIKKACWIRTVIGSPRLRHDKIYFIELPQ